MHPAAADPLSLLRARTSEKWTAFPPEVLPLFVAEMDYALAPVVAETIIDRVRASDTGYVGSPGPIGPSFASFAERTWGWAVDPASVLTATDVSVGIVETLRLVVAPGEKVVITPPVYPPFFDLVREAGAVVVDVPILEGVSDADPASLDLAGLERAFADGARAFLLCNPHNPLGLVHSAATLARVAALAQQYGVVVISDEIHGPLVHSGADFTPYLTVSDEARDHGIVVTSASKAWNLAGVKCAVMVTASERMRSLLSGLPEEVGFRTSLLGLHASVAAFDHGADWLASVIDAIEASSGLLQTLLAERLPAVAYRPPSASYLAWLDFRATDWGDDPSIRALAAGVALNPGPSFGVQGAGFTRLNFACGPEVLVEAIDRLARG